MSREWASRLCVVLVFVLTLCVSAIVALLWEWPKFDLPDLGE